MERERAPGTGSIAARLGPDTAPAAPPRDLAAIYETHAPTLVRTLVLAGFPDAVDAVQEAFVQACLHWRKVRAYDDPVAWIRRVAVNRGRNHSRAQRRQRSLSERVRREPVAPVGPATTDDALTGAITRLPPQQRLAVVLFYFDDLSVAQTASAMGISEGAVKYHLHAARTALAAHLEVDRDA